VLKRFKLATARDGLQRGTLPRGLIAINKIDNLGAQNEEPAIDPSPVTRWFFLKALNAGAFAQKRTITPRRLHRCDRGKLAMLVMKSDLLRHINIRYTIAISEAEYLFILNEGGEPL
jgi:hypothetical protein